jgi:serine/threonine protein kinase
LLSTLALGRLPFELTKRYMLDVANGLCYLHSVDIAHRDLSPFNVCISLDGARAVIIDFGSSKENRHANKSVHIPTMLPYASPEVLHHNKRANESPRVWSRAAEIAADVYSLGMTLARCVAPSHSYWNHGGNNADTFKLDETTRDIDVHERLDQLLQAALHKDPSKRPRSAEFAADLRAVPHLQSLVRIRKAPWRDFGRHKLPPLFRINALPNLYIRSAWPDGTEARHADVALLELRDTITTHKAVCDKYR